MEDSKTTNTINKIIKNGEHICGEIPYRRDGKYIYFGRWPQSKKAKDISIIEEKKITLPYKPKYYGNNSECTYSYYIGSDNEIYIGDKENYYKVEPIRWQIIEEKDETALLLSDYILFKCYYGSFNIYNTSDILENLNDFYERAFINEEKEIIITTMLDNSAESTGYEKNPYTCDNFEDEIFLLSFKEAFEIYGLSDRDRQKEPTEYVKNIDSYCYDWFLRSPDIAGEYCVRTVNKEGKADIDQIDGFFYNNYPDAGIVPALRIRLKD